MMATGACKGKVTRGYCYTNHVGTSHLWALENKGTAIKGGKRRLDEAVTLNIIEC